MADEHISRIVSSLLTNSQNVNNESSPSPTQITKEEGKGETNYNTPNASSKLTSRPCSAFSET